MATVPHPSKTLLAVLAIGLLCGTPIVLADSPQQGSRAYQATAFDPETEADVLAHRSNEVTTLSHYAETNRTRRLLQRAADGETVTFAEDDSELASLANENDHAVYRGAYYRLNATERNETVTLRLEPSSADAVMRDLAVEYESTRPAVQRVVDRGNGTVSTANESIAAAFGDDVPSVVDRNGTYYVLETANPLTVFVRVVLCLFWLLIGSTLAWLAGGYIGVSLGVLATTAAYGRCRALTTRSSLAVVAFAAVFSSIGVTAWRLNSVGGGISSPGSQLLSTLLTVPSAVALALLLVVGVTLRQGASGPGPIRAGALVVGTIVLGAAIDAAAAESAFLFVSSAVIDSVTTAVFGLPLVALGYVHAAEPDDGS